MTYRIPQELVDMLVERRVIPFVGAGFSASVGLPTWDELLERITTKIDTTISFADLQKFCNNDPLQIAEYLLLRCDSKIGPLRHQLAMHLTSHGVKPARSGAHVELVNLNAPQIYTTNFDELIEQTFADLGDQADVVSLPKHIALSSSRRPQIIKYHGDLQHESTLVLAESSYYSRLDFESPVDLKFRSDLLGKSVLFMGYSFRDINIRIIWFKLMKMMKDIPAGDRPTSYIVRFEPNPAIELLYESVGLKTIILDATNSADTAEKKTQLFARFMLDLATAAASSGKMPGSTKPMYVSQALLQTIRDAIENRRSRRFFRSPSAPVVEQLATRAIPAALAHQTAEVLTLLARADFDPSLLVRAAKNYLSQHGPHPSVAVCFVRALGSEDGREAIFEQSIEWQDVWMPIESTDASEILDSFEAELKRHEEGYVDDDLAYLADVLSRMKARHLVTSDDLVERANALLKAAAERYPAIGRLDPSATTTQPTPLQVIDEIRAAGERGGDSSVYDDIPF